MSNPSNSDLVGEAKRLSEAATPGPWQIDGSSSRDWGIRSLARETPHGEQPIIADILGHSADPDRQADAEFIARARTLLPELAQQLEQAEQRAERLEAVITLSVLLRRDEDEEPDHYEHRVRVYLQESLKSVLTPDEEADPGGR